MMGEGSASSPFSFVGCSCVLYIMTLPARCNLTGACDFTGAMPDVKYSVGQRIIVDY